MALGPSVLGVTQPEVTPEVLGFGALVMVVAAAGTSVLIAAVALLSIRVGAPPRLVRRTAGAAALLAAGALAAWWFLALPPSALLTVPVVGLALSLVALALGFRRPRVAGDDAAGDDDAKPLTE